MLFSGNTNGKTTKEDNSTLRPTITAGPESPAYRIVVWITTNPPAPGLRTDMIFYLPAGHGDPACWWWPPKDSKRGACAPVSTIPTGWAEAPGLLSLAKPSKGSPRAPVSTKNLPISNKIRYFRPNLAVIRETNWNLNQSEL